VTTATKKKPKVVRDLKKLPAALGLKKETVAKAEAKKPARSERSLLQSDHDTLEAARAKARLIRGLRHEEDGLASELKEKRERIKSETDSLNAILLDIENGQSRLDLRIEKAGAAEKSAHAPVETWSETKQGAATLRVVKRTGPRGDVYGYEAEAPGVLAASVDDIPTFADAAERAFKSAGIPLDLLKSAKWALIPTPANPLVPAGVNGKPAAKGSVEAVVGSNVLRVQPVKDDFVATLIDASGDGEVTEREVGRFRDEGNAKKALVEEIGHDGKGVEWKPVTAAKETAGK
jgi:hypothetical protein